MKTKNTLLWLFILFIVGFALGFVIKAELIGQGAEVFCDAAAFPHINRTIICSGVPVIKKHGYAILKNKIDAYVRAKMKEKKLSNASVYFHDLESGPTMGINEHAQFIPASLLKLPLMMTYLNLAEEKPELLKKTLGYRIEGEINDPPPQFFSSEKIQENKPYTIEGLLRHMIIYSDNDAYLVLMNYLQELSPGVDQSSEMLRNVGIIPPNSSIDAVITVKNYSMLFQMLYNSVFLHTPEGSEKALSWLVTTKFDEGLSQGIPPGIEIAHKFGERSDYNGNEKQLHDCGIVYYPGNPYLLCIMTRGTDFNELSETIGDISRMTYEEFDSRRIK